MPTRIHEYDGALSAPNRPSVYPADLIVSQTAITASGTSQQSAVFNVNTTMVVIDTDEKVCVRFGVNPIAATANIVVPAGAKDAFNLPAANVGYRVAVIAG